MSLASWTTGTTSSTTTVAYNEIYSTYFNGTISQYGMVSDSRSLDFGRSAFGISLWMKATSGVIV